MTGAMYQRIRNRVVRDWRNAGRYDFTARELAEETQNRLDVLHEKQSGIYASQFPLLDSGMEARQAKSDACRSTRSLRINRRKQIEKLLHDAGAEGLTRRELSTLLQCEPGGVTSPVLYLIKQGLACEPFRRQCPVTGKPVAVVVLREHLVRQHKERSHAS